MKDKLIIDGYNVIHNWPLFKGDLEKSLEVARRRLLRRMEGYQKRSGVKVTVVFDVRFPDARKVRRGRWNGVKVVFTSAERSSDSLIRSMIKSTQERSSIMVASSDETLNQEVSKLGAQVVEAKAFREEMYHNPEDKPNSTRNRTNSGAIASLSDHLDKDTFQALIKLRGKS